MVYLGSHQLTIPSSSKAGDFAKDAITKGNLVYMTTSNSEN